MRNAQGALRVVEVKTTEGLVAGALSKEQALGVDYFARSRLGRALRQAGAWAATHDPDMFAKADAILNELHPTSKAKGFVMEMTLGDGGISFVDGEEVRGHGYDE